MRTGVCLERVDTEIGDGCLWLLLLLETWSLFIGFIRTVRGFDAAGL